MPPPLQVDLLTLKVVSESRVTWATSVPILVFLGISVLNLGPMYATGRQDVRQTDVKHASSLNASALWGRGITRALTEPNLRQGSCNPNPNLTLT